MAVSPSFPVALACATTRLCALVEIAVFQVRLPVRPRPRKIAAEQAVDKAVMDVGHDPRSAVFPVSLVMIVPHPRIDALPDGNHLIESCRDQQLLVKRGIVVEHFLDVLVLAGTFAFCA